MAKQTHPATRRTFMLQAAAALPALAALESGLVVGKETETRAPAQVRPDWFKDKLEDRLDDAEAAGRIMKRDRSAGEQEFQRLLADHPREGAIYLVRGRAYEALGLKDLATDDYRHAVELCPDGDLFKEGARCALLRVTS
jgi:Flp pilus assembly protein TadD